jgi:hypothetical protein
MSAYLKGNARDNRLTARLGEDDRLRRGCEGKVGHTSKKIATGKMRVLAQSRGGRPLRVYSCPACRRWHVGSY